MFSVNTNSFPFSLPIWMLLISFSCLLALARIYSKMSSSSGNKKHPYLIPHLKKKAFCLLP